MINWRIIARILGQLLSLEVGCLFIAMIIALFTPGDEGLAFATSAASAALVAALLTRLGGRVEATLQRRDSYLVVSLVWVVFSIFGSLPFLLTGTVTNPVDAFFETMSGFTTTGATTIADVESLPPALLFWRSLTQWIGGLGIVFLTIAVIPSLSGGSVRIFSAEATGPMRARMHPRLSTTGRWIWGIYIVLTVACALCYFLCGLDIFASINYAMTITATGGFAIDNDPAPLFHKDFVALTTTVFMFLSGISFTLLYAAIFKRKFRQFWQSAELRLYIGIIVTATIGITISQFTIHNTPSFTASPFQSLSLSTFLSNFQTALFHVVSFVTTTGIFCVSADETAVWPLIAWIILLACALIGGCSGSTSGGLKCVRAVMLWRIVRAEVRRLIHPSAVLPVRVSGSLIPLAGQTSLLAFTALYAALTIGSAVIMLLIGLHPYDAGAVAISCASNVGPTLGLAAGESVAWSTLPDAVKLLLTVLMLMGRLEIMSVLVLFTPAFWRDR